MQQTISVNVVKINQTITFTSANPTPVNVGATYTPSANGGASGNPVVFTIDAASTAGACSITSGVVHFNAAGTCIVDANQAGNASYNAAAQVQQTITVHVALTSTTTTLTVTPSTRTYGDEDDVVFSVVVHATSGTPSGTVTIKSGATVLCVITLSAAKGQCSTSNTILAVGTQGVVAVYSGDTHYAGSTSTSQSVVITKDTSKTVVSSSAGVAAYGAENLVQFSATVSAANSEPIPAGEGVTIHVGSVTCSATTNAAGVATCTISATALVAGSYTVSATYVGDTNITGSSSANAVAFLVGVKPVFTSATTTSVAVGHTLNFHVSATGSPAPTYSISGTLPHGVTFNAATGVLSGTPTFGTQGTYTLTITATNALGSTSQTFTLTVTAH